MCGGLRKPFTFELNVEDKMNEGIRLTYTSVSINACILNGAIVSFLWVFFVVFMLSVGAVSV